MNNASWRVIPCSINVSYITSAFVMLCCGSAAGSLFNETAIGRLLSEPPGIDASGAGSPEVVIVGEFDDIDDDRDGCLAGNCDEGCSGSLACDGRCLGGIIRDDCSGGGGAGSLGCDRNNGGCPVAGSIHLPVDVN